MTNNNKLKKALSLVMTLVMVLTMIPALTAGLYNRALAADVKSASTTIGNLKFIVPEAIYLYPDAVSSRASTSTPFQYYINNGSDGSVQTAYDTTGKIYYEYGSAQNASLSYRFVNESFNSVGDSNSTITLSQSTNLGTSKTINITYGKSPSLAYNSDGCYIEWILSFTDSTDGKAKKAYAYTYVYKPYTVPVASGSDAGTGTSSGANWAGSITWISGFHYLTEGTKNSKGDWDEDYWRYTNLTNFSAFISKNSTGYVNGTSTTGSNSRTIGNKAYTVFANNATTWYTVFSNSSDYGYYLEIPDDSCPARFGSDNSSNDTAPVHNFMCGKYRENTKNVQACIYNNTYGNINVDISRYQNLKDIPNLAIGMLVSDNEEVKSGDGGNWSTWYIADYTGLTCSGYNTWHTDADNRGKYYNDKGTVYASQGSGPTETDYYNDEGVRYAGAWPKEMSVSSSTTQGSSGEYMIKGFYGNEDGGYYASSHCVVKLRTYYYNKSNLRTAVQNATAAMAKLGVNGISSGALSSCYFDSSSSNGTWTTLQNAYKAAVLGLTNLQSTSDPDALANALNNALANLYTKVSFNGNGGTLNGVSPVYVKIGTNQSVQFQPDDYLGNYSGDRTGYSLKSPDKRWSTDPNAVNGSKAVTVGYNDTVYAIWAANTYSVAFANGYNNTGSMSNQSFTYNEAKALSANEYNRKNTLTLDYNYTGSTNDTLDASYTFDGWDGENIVNDTGTYTKTGSGNYTEIKQYTVDVPYNGFKTGERYVFEFDAKGSGSLTTYFYGAGDYKRVARGVCSNGVTSTNTDGNVGIALTADYVHYTVTYTLGSAGDGNQVKYLLLRVFPGNTATVKNITAHKIYENQETVINLRETSGHYQMTARWLDPSPVTLPGATRNGYTFDGWYTDKTTQNESTFYGNVGDQKTLTGNKTVYAKWTPATYTITYIEGDDISTQPYTFNTTPNAYSLKTSTPPTGYIFAGWKVTVTAGSWPAVGTIVGTNSSNSSTRYQYGDVTLTAQYNPKSYTANVTIGEHGAISGAPTGVVHDGTYTFTVSLSDGYDTETPQVYAENCTCTLSGSGASYTATISNVTGAVYVHITPKATQRTVTVNVGDGIGLNSELSTLKVDHNGTATLVVTLDEAYTDLVAKIGETALTPTVNGSTYTYTIPNVQSNITVDLTATHKSYTVTLNASDAADYNLSSPQTVFYGEDLTFSVTMKAGYTQNEPTVEVDGTVLAKLSGSDGTYTYEIKNIKEDKQVVVTGTLNTYTVQVDTDEGLEAVADTTVTHGGSYNLTLTLKEGYTATAPTARIGETPVILTKQSDTVYTGTVTNVTDNLTINASSNVNEYTVSIYGDAGATLSDTAFTDVTHGDNVSFTVTLNEGYTKTAPVVKNGDDTISPASVNGFVYTYTFTVTADMVITVATKINEYMIRFVLPGSGEEIWHTTVPHGTTPAYAGEELDTTSDENQHYVFTNVWTPAFVPATEDATYTLEVTGADHQWNEGVETLAPKCFEAGETTYTCEVCGRTRTEPIAEIGHHNWNEGEVTTQPTCTEAGVRTFTCSVCNDTYTEPVTATGHSYGAWLPYNNNLHAHYCSHDHSHYETAAHDWDDGVYSEGFSCTAGGTQTFTCRECGATRVEHIAANQGHQWGEWVTIKAGNEDHYELQRRTCLNCGSIQEQSVPVEGGSAETNPSNVGKLNKLSFWDWILSIFHKIAGLFQKMHL